jgi:hypothetical protein
LIAFINASFCHSEDHFAQAFTDILSSASFTAHCPMSFFQSAHPLENLVAPKLISDLPLSFGRIILVLTIPIFFPFLSVVVL